MPRIDCPDFPDLGAIIQPGWRVADYGGGTNPYPKAHVVIDNDPGGWVDRCTDGKDAREFDLEVRTADVQALQGVVADKEFDFVIASHVAEHVDNPIAFCREMIRTAKRGYIETPSPIYEAFFTWASHKWMVEVRNDALCFREKNATNCPGYMLFNAFGGTGPFEHLRARHEPSLRTIFLWEGDFKWVIEN